MLKRIISLFLLATFLIVSVPFSVSADTTYTRTATGINSSRGENALIIYTSYYGYYTNTNAYGYEVVVTNGVVSSVGGNNSNIPSGSSSFVVSGHGTEMDWLSANIIVGMKASYTYSYSLSSYVLTFTIDSTTYKYMVDQARAEAVEAKAFAAEACLIYDSDADSRFAAAESTYNSTSNFTEANALTLTAEYKEISALYREREIAEYRGVWIRPVQTSAAQVNAYVKKLYDAGINMISIETMYAGTMIMPMPSDSLFEQNPKFNGFDVLEAYINACHKYGMELHCWMPVFYSYCANDANGDSYTLSPGYKKPEWCLVNQNGVARYSDETETQAMVFLNPALDEVQDFLAESYEYILKNYDIDGFQLDYIRYRDRYGSDDFGYDDTTISLFKQAYPQYRFASITYNTSANYWNSWVNFRISLITKFVERMRTLIDEIAPEVTLSADVGPSLDTAKACLYQDSASWMQAGLLDMIHPMAYSEGGWDYVEPFFNYVGDGCLVVPGLGAYVDDFDAEDMLRHAIEMAEIGCEGVVYFEAGYYLSKNCDKVLSASLYTEKSLAPSYNDTNTALKVMDRFIERVNKASSTGKITSALASQLVSAANTAKSVAESGANNALYNFIDIRSSLSSISSTSVGQRLIKDINIAIDAAYRDPGLAYDNSLLADGTVPNDAVGAVQLTIDKVNGEITGEDSVLITDLNLSYTRGWENALLLKPVSGETDVYTVVDVYNGVENNGSGVSFSTAVTSGMLIAAFHSDGTGSGNERYELAATIEVGTELGLFGVDVAGGTQLYRNSMLYVIGTGIGDVELGEGTFGESKPFWLTQYEDNTVEGGGVAFVADTTTAWRLAVAFSPIGTTGVYEITRIVNHLANGSGTTISVPEDGFVYTLNRGNDYTSTDGPNYTSTSCNSMISDALTWKVGDKLEISGLDLDTLNIPTSTPELNWYDANYVCTATYREFTPGESSSDTSSDNSSDNSKDDTSDSSDAEISADMFWVTHYNDLTAEGAGVIVTETGLSGGEWNNYYAFAPVAGTKAYEIVEIDIGVGEGGAQLLEIPAGGFVYSINRGNDYPSLNSAGASAGQYPDKPDYTSDNCNSMINTVSDWKIGDRFVFNGLDISGRTVPTSTPGLYWYEDGYVCTATFAAYDGSSTDNSSDESSADNSADNSADDSANDSADNSTGSDTSKDESNNNSDITSDAVYEVGDVNADGSIDQFDYLLVKRDYFNTYTLSKDELKRADVNYDSVVDQFDYILLKRVYFGTYEIEKR